MNARPLIIDEHTKRIVEQVVRHADQNPVRLETLEKMVSGQMGPIGNDPRHCCIIPFEYQCCFSFEQQKVGMCRHLSVSVSGTGVAPNPSAMLELMSLFGFIGGFQDCLAVYTEGISGSSKVAVSVIQKI